MLPSPALDAYLDESIVGRAAGLQEYLVCASVLEVDDIDDVRQELRRLLLPGQFKVHWHDEGEMRRRRMIDAIAAIGPMNVIVAHLDQRRRTTERFRRKCLEVLYHELAAMPVHDLVLESRGAAQDKADRAHIVALQNGSLTDRLRISHRRGGEEPLLWIPDAVLGAVNAASRGERHHLQALEQTIMVRTRTAASRVTDAGERP